MIFKTEKKEFEIIKFGMSYAGNHKSTTFKLVVSKPFEAEAVFNAGDVGQREKVDGIIFNEYSNIAKALNTKKDVLFSLPPDALKFVHDTNAQEIETLRKIEEAKEITKWFWAVGGDSGDLYLANGNEIDTEFRPDLEAIEKVIEKTRGKGNIWQLLRDKSQPIDRKTALYTNQWYEISNSDLVEIHGIIQRQEDEIGKEKKAKQEAREKARQEVFATAKATGVRQILHQWSEECNDKNEECGLDNIIEYALPDGTTKTERNHTW